MLIACSRSLNVCSLPRVVHWMLWVRRLGCPARRAIGSLFTGRCVRVLLAEPEAVLLSKALNAPVKNAALVTAYLASGPTQRFMALASKYGLDLDPFLR